MENPFLLKYPMGDVSPRGRTTLGEPAPTGYSVVENRRTDFGGRPLAGIRHSSSHFRVSDTCAKGGFVLGRPNPAWRAPRPEVKLLEIRTPESLLRRDPAAEMA